MGFLGAGHRVKNLLASPLVVLRAAKTKASNSDLVFQSCDTFLNDLTGQQAGGNLLTSRCVCLVLQRPLPWVDPNLRWTNQLSFKP